MITMLLKIYSLYMIDRIPSGMKKKSRQTDLANGKSGLVNTA